MGLNDVHLLSFVKSILKSILLIEPLHTDFSEIKSMHMITLPKGSSSNIAGFNMTHFFQGYGLPVVSHELRDDVLVLHYSKLDGKNVVDNFVLTAIPKWRAGCSVSGVFAPFDEDSIQLEAHIKNMYARNFYDQITFDYSWQGPNLHLQSTCIRAKVTQTGIVKGDIFHTTSRPCKVNGSARLAVLWDCLKPLLIDNLFLKSTKGKLDITFNDTPGTCQVSCDSYTRGKSPLMITSALGSIQFATDRSPLIKNAVNSFYEDWVHKNQWSNWLGN